MDAPVIGTPKQQTLIAGEGIHIIACEHPSPTRCIGVRWASWPNLGFPPKGYRISRANAQPGFNPNWLQLGTFVLPVTDSWADFELDANNRRPVCGQYFPSITEDTHGFLLPLVRFADPRTDEAEDIDLTLQAEAFFGPVHESDAELEWNFWRGLSPPSLATLLADPTAAPDVIKFYRQTTVDFLLILALRFEYAVLFGLGFNDARATDNGTVQYMVEAHWGSTSGVAISQPVADGQQCLPPAPSWTSAAREPGSIPHRVFQSWPGWVAPAELAPVNADGTPMPLSAPRGPAAFTALSWAAAPPEPNLIGYGPVLYEVKRFAHGAASAAQLTPPAAPPTAGFQEIIPGDLVIRSDDEPHFVDLPGMDWPPLEGWYSYQVRGVDLLGERSNPAPLAVLRHHDDFPPPPPGAALLETHALTFNNPGDFVDVPIKINWGAAEDFAGQDTIEFRVAGTWVPLTSIPVHVVSSVDADTLHADLTVSTLPGVADQYAGISLSLPGADFPIVSNGSGTNAAIRVRKVNGNIPSANVDGAIYAPGTATPLTRLAKQNRRPAVAGTITTVSSTNPLEFNVTAAGSDPVPSDSDIRIYIHVLRASFDAVRLAANRYRITEPPAGQSGAESLAKWRALPGPATLLAGSPLIFFPDHTLTVTTRPPNTFISGLLMLGVSAADATAYVDSPVLPVAAPSLAAPRGNESTRTELAISVRSLAPPAAVEVPPWDSNVRTWAESAANYAESATFLLSWAASTDAARYEVWRVPEGALTGVTGLTSDADVRAAAAAQPETFELRSDQVFSASYLDYLSGRAPTRALYKVRAVSLAGVVGAWSDIIGPVYVPDVRQPGTPNLLRVAPAPQSEIDRALALEWTLAGPRDSVRFDILMSEGTTNAFAAVGSVARDTPPDPATARYRWVHSGLTPGRRYTYKVIAVREALDPIDSSASLRRDIAGPPSTPLTGTAISYGPLLSPTAVTATQVSASGPVMVSWANNDVYESIEIWRRPVTSSLYVRVGTSLTGATMSSEDLPPVGTWSYQVRAFGVRREARSEVEAEITVS